MDPYALIIYLITGLFVALVIYRYIWKATMQSHEVSKKIAASKEQRRYEPISLYPHIDPNKCIGSGACVRACPEKDVLGILRGRGTLINTTSCVGHGACFMACPVDAITLRIGTEERGVELPHIKPDYETNVPGMYIAGELGGMGLIKNSMEQGIQAITGVQKKCAAYSDDRLDLVIVGAGPAGIGASLKAKEAQLKFKLLEQDSLGGTVYTFPRSKIVMTHPVELPMYGKLQLSDTSKDELLTVWNELISTYDIPLTERCKVERISPQDGHFILELNTGEQLEANHVLLAIGRRGTPRKLGVPGELNQRVAYRLLEPEEIEGERILVVGGGDSAVESAMLLMDRNTVFLSYRKDSFGRIKPQNADRLEAASRAGKLQILYSSEVVEILEEDVLMKGVDVPDRLEQVDKIYIFAGGELPTEFLKNVGIDFVMAKNKIVRKH